MSKLHLADGCSDRNHGPSVLCLELSDVPREGEGGGPNSRLRGPVWGQSGVSVG